MEGQHGADLIDDGGTARRHQLPLPLDPQALYLVERHALGHIAIDQVMRAGLVGDDIGDDAAPGDLGIDFGGIADKADGGGTLFGYGLFDHVERAIKVRGDGFEIADFLAFPRPLRVDIDAEDRPARHAPGQRLGAAHAAQPGGEDEPPGQIAAKAVFGDAHEDLIGALDDALAADILPRARRQPAPADQPLALQLVEHLRLGPLPHQIAIGHDDQRRPGMSSQ